MAVQGVAAKGIIMGGKVEAFEIGTDGKLGTTAIASGKTDENGRYSISIPKGVLKFVVKVSHADGAEMVNEATGTTDPFPNGLVLRNIVMLDQAASTYEGHVSPLTEMVVQAVGDNFDSENVGRIKNGVENLLGFNPEKTKPIDPRNPPADAKPEEQLQSLALAAISHLAQQGALDCTVPAEATTCVVGKVAASATLKDNNVTLDNQAALRNALIYVTDPANGINNNPDVKSLAGRDTFTKPSVPAPTPTAATGVAAARALIASLRNTGTSVSNDLDQSVLSMKQDFNKSVAPLDAGLFNWIAAIPAGIDHFISYKNGTFPYPESGSDDLFGSTECGIYSDAAGTTLASAPANALNIKCSSTQYLSYSWTENGSTEIRLHRGITLTPADAGLTSYNYQAHTRIETITYNSSTPEGKSEFTPFGYYNGVDYASGTISFSKSNAQLQSVRISGMMPARVNSSGGMILMTAATSPTSSDITAITDHELWDVKYDRIAEGSNVFKYALTADFTSMKDGLAVGKMSIAPNSYVRVQEDGQGKTAKNGLKAFNLVLSSENGTSKVSGTLNLANGKTDKNGERYLPTKASFTGTLQSNAKQLFSGTLSYELPTYQSFDSTKPPAEDNILDEAVGLSGILNIPNRPALTVSINASTKNAFATTTLSGKYDDGKAVINVSVMNGAAGKTINVSGNGISFTIAPGQRTADLMKDSTKLGVIDLDKGQVDFVDGTFESLL